MINIREFQPSTIEVFKKVCTEKREILDYMSKFGTTFEKTMADMILSIRGDNNGK
jgi:hypothetical protein